MSNLNLKFKDGVVEDFTLVLCTRDYTKLGRLKNVANLEYVTNLNSADEISFVVNEYVNGEQEILWDKLQDLLLVWVKEQDEYFEITVSYDDTYDTIKTVTGTSLCEAELCQTILRNLEINTETDIARTDYTTPTVFYNPTNTKASLLHRVLDKTPNYSIKYVPEHLWNIQRSFSANGTSVYDFLVNDVGQEYDVLFTFDSTDRSISVYDLETYCPECGYRGIFNDKCPKCGNTELMYYGEDTTVFVTKENLTDNIKLECNTDAIKNTFYLTAGDDDMTTAVMNCNSGGRYIYHFNHDQLENMSDGLREKLREYESAVSIYSPQYENLAKDYYTQLEKYYYFKDTMMPQPSGAQTNVTVETEAQKIIDGFALKNKVSLTNNTTSKSTVDNAVKTCAKLMVATGFVNVTIKSSNISPANPTSSTPINSWSGVITVTSWSDDTDYKDIEINNVAIDTDYPNYVSQKIKVAMDNYKDTDTNNVLSIGADIFALTDENLIVQSLNNLKYKLSLYCHSSLESFYQAFKTCESALMDLSVNNTLFNEVCSGYISNCKRVVIASYEVLQSRITDVERYDPSASSSVTFATLQQMTELKSKMNFDEILGDYHIEFCNYRREDEYSNNNFISDGLETDELFTRAEEFLDIANKELIKSSTYQYTIGANLNNFLLMPEFEPLYDHFKLGNWIRIKVGKDIYRLRLIKYSINFDNITTINTEFSTVTRTAEGYNDIESILSEASSMSKSYSTVTKQAGEGVIANKTVNNFVEEGLNTALVSIRNNTSETPMIDNTGIHLLSYDEFSDSYSPKQGWITSNLFLYTKDNWQTASLALGEHEYYYVKDGEITKDTDFGLTSKFVQAGNVLGSQILGGEIFSDNYSASKNTGTHFDLRSGNFELGNKSIVFKDGKMTFGSGVILSWNNIDSPDDLATTGDIPTNISQLNNDSGYQTVSGVNNAIKVYDYTEITKNYVTSPFIATLNLEVGNQIKMGADAKITWGQVTGTENIATKSYVTSQGYETAESIKQTVITKDYIETLQIKAGSVAAENITGTTISGKTINGGAISIGSDSTHGFHVGSDGWATAQALKTYEGIEIVGANEIDTPYIDFKRSSELLDYECRIIEYTLGELTFQKATDSGSGMFNCKINCGDIASSNNIAAGNHIFANGNIYIQGKQIKNGAFLDLEINSGAPIVEIAGNSSVFAYRIPGGEIFNCSAFAASDIRLKKDIDTTKVNALKLFDDIKVCEWNWKKDGTHKNIGFIADWLMEEIPEAVVEVEQGDEAELSTIKQIDMTKIVPYTVKAIQELHEIIKSHQEIIDRQQQQINELLSAVEILKGGK